MLLAGKRKVGNRYALSPQRRDHALGLIGRHHFIFQPLQENDRTVQLLDMVDRRTLAIYFAVQRKARYQPVAIARLEFMRLAYQSGEIAHPVVARASFECVAKGKRSQSCVAAGAAPANDKPRRVNEVAGD